MSDTPLINPTSQQLFLRTLNNPDDGDLGGMFDIFKKGGGGESWKDKKTLRKGSQGTDVEDLQTRLGISADGSFGSGTEREVKQFQRDHDLPDTGVVDSDTWAALYGKKTSVQRAASKEKTANTIKDITGFLSSTIGQLSDKDKEEPDKLVDTGVGDEEPGTPPWVWVAGGVVLLGVIGGGIYLMTRDDD